VTAVAGTLSFAPESVLLAVVLGIAGLAAGAGITRLAGGFPWAERRLGAPAVRPPVLEVGTALLFTLVALCLGLAWDLTAFLVLAAVGVLLAVIDLRHRLLPNRVLLPAFAAGAVLLTGAAAATGDWSRLLRAGLGAVVLLAVFLVLALVAPSGLGMGDVKLAGLLGLHLGWLGWTALVLGGAAGFVVQALLALVLLAIRRIGLRSELPFGPAMLLGALFALVGTAIVG
jgi:leader peptidase (prepilin peptidase)/N-methyltransferase